MTTPNRIYLSPPQTTQLDRSLLLDALESNWIAPLGPHVDAFEAEFAEKVETPYAVALSSGTAALHLALIVAGVRPGDWVITPSLTFAATANAILHAGAKPYFVDSCPNTWTLDPELAEQAAKNLVESGERVTAMLPVDLFGQCADYDALRDTCQRHQLRLIADAAEALGATYRGRPAGSVAELGCFSFNGNKIITTSGGGMVVAHRKEWADRIRKLAAQARLPGVDYQHDEIGYNYRLSNLLAALGRGQLDSLDARVQKRRAISRAYQRALGDMPGIIFMPEADYGESTNWLTCILVEPDITGCTPEDIRLALEEQNIESRPVWRPLHLQPAFRSEIFQKPSSGHISVAERLWRHGLCLPSGPTLSAGDQLRVTEVIRRVASQPGKQAA
ncbi:DegT/DnrJ/EryC1/StrS family aminotransferase [Pirellulales bacterium]|nr:DegT/DnrJ/EryC1/StrS family aminotransferase [Pirellulales bacterium]